MNDTNKNNLLTKNLKKLARLDTELGDVIKDLDNIKLRTREGGFSALLRAIVGQQLSVKAAAAIWLKLENAKLTTEESIESASDSELRICGLSRQKIKYAKALSAQKINYVKLKSLKEEEVVGILTAVPGIGRWTAEIYLMFCLDRADIFPSGDLALQEATKILYSLLVRPKEKEMREIAQKWKPFRSLAALVLWEFYAINKKREGV
ncbi:MAG: DNA-3-methyladenine glycosylase family protein [Paracoccaceae bacterium]